MLLRSSSVRFNKKQKTVSASSRLVTSTPEFDGRSFGTNVMEGVLVALSGKRPEELTPQDYMDLLKRINWTPRIVDL